MTIDVAKNRAATKYAASEQAGRVLWGAAALVFRVSPRPLYGFRRWLLRLFGARVGKHVNISSSAKIYFPWMLEIGDFSSIGDDAYLYNLGRAVIGRRATISQRAHLCGGSHDYTDPAMTLIRAPIAVHDDAWICADAFVGPGVVVGEGAIVGARAAVFQHVEPWTIVGGNPAKFLKLRTPPGAVERVT